MRGTGILPVCVSTPAVLVLPAPNVLTGPSNREADKIVQGNDGITRNESKGHMMNNASYPPRITDR
jgi:hypothetical protein